MKKLIFAVLVLLQAQFALAQAPQGFSYQAIARDNAGNPKANTDISVKFTIIQDLVEGLILYSENHQTKSNTVGLFNLIIGQGKPTIGIFSTIDWKSPKYLKVEIDGQLLSTTPLLSVTYALYAEKTNLKAAEGIAVNNGNEIKNIGDLSPTNEIQQLQLNGNVLSLSKDGGSIVLPNGGGSQWRDTTIAFKHIYYDGPVYIGTKGGSLGKPNLVATQASTDPTNNLIAVIQRYYYTKAVAFGFYGYADDEAFSNAYLRGVSMMYAPLVNKALQLTAASGDIRFTTGGFASDDFERMRILSNGNIGIGTIAPATKLQVKSGDIFIEDVSRGVIMKSPNGNCWQMTVTDQGTPLFTRVIPCPIN